MSELATRLGRLSKSWRLLSKFAVWLVAIAVLIVAPPPRLWAGAAEPDYLRLGQFVVAILTGLFLLRRWSSRWVAVAAALCLALGVAGFFAYSGAVANWTCEYDGRGPVLVGSAFTPKAAEYVASHPELAADCRRLIQEDAGRTDLIWDRGELFRRHQILGAGFLLTILMFSAAAGLLLDALDQRKSKKKTP